MGRGRVWLYTDRVWLYTDRVWLDSQMESMERVWLDLQMELGLDLSLMYNGLYIKYCLSGLL